MTIYLVNKRWQLFQQKLNNKKRNVMNLKSCPM
nr:MAG TPA: hypothetical protein [Caudoviricetes sp.]